MISWFSKNQKTVKRRTLRPMWWWWSSAVWNCEKFKFILLKNHSCATCHGRGYRRCFTCKGHGQLLHFLQLTVDFKVNIIIYFIKYYIIRITTTSTSTSWPTCPTSWFSKWAELNCSKRKPIALDVSLAFQSKKSTRLLKSLSRSMRRHGRRNCVTRSVLTFIPLFPIFREFSFCSNFLNFPGSFPIIQFPNFLFISSERFIRNKTYLNVASSISSKSNLRLA